MNKSLFSILLDLFVCVLLSVATIYSMQAMKHATEEIEVIRYGFNSVVCIIALVGTVVVQRMKDLWKR